MKIKKTNIKINIQLFGDEVAELDEKIAENTAKKEEKQNVAREMQAKISKLEKQNDLLIDKLTTSPANNEEPTEKNISNIMKDYNEETYNKFNNMSKEEALEFTINTINSINKIHNPTAQKLTKENFGSLIKSEMLNFMSENAQIKLKEKNII